MTIFQIMRDFIILKKGIKDFNRNNPYGIIVEFINEWE